jgi:hypothetical protein
MVALEDDQWESVISLAPQLGQLSELPNSLFKLDSRGAQGFYRSTAWGHHTRVLLRSLGLETRRARPGGVRCGHAMGTA